LRSPRSPLRWLLAKEWRELWSARAWWLMLAVTGPLVGVSFINAVQLYAELSGYNGTAAGVGEAFSPLVGVWAPTFSSYELIAAFLFPFVVIRLVGGDRQSGALKLELQQPLSPVTRIGAKAAVLLTAWGVAFVPAMLAGVLWKSYGGSVYAPEIAAVAFGHILNALLTIAFGAAAATLAEHPSTAAIIVLAITVGSWVISFFAAIRGGVWERLSNFTPTSMVAQFQHGLIRLDVLVSVVALIALGLLVAATWMRLGDPLTRRLAVTAALIAGAGLVVAAGTFARQSWDASENRQNSFPEPDEEVLRTITQPLTIEAHLAAEDGRRDELERVALSKLRRAVPHLVVRYVARTSAGMFEQNTEHYGEIIYEYGGRQQVSRIVTAEGVLESVYAVTGVTPAAENEDDLFRGHPLPVPPRHAGAVFYGIWPAIVAGAWVFHRRTA
jgi:hypothetical protein